MVVRGRAVGTGLSSGVVECGPDSRAMPRRVSTVDTLGEIDALTPDECAEAADAVLDRRDDWISRSPTGLFWTLGVNAYMDLARAGDPDASYFGPARRTNATLRQRFAPLYAKVADALEQDVGLPTRYADDLALPGFHIWTGNGIPRTPSASIHFDLQYQRLLARPRYASASGVVSFTLPIRLPFEGSSLRIWPECIYGDDGLRRPEVARSEPEIVEYRLGRAIVHTGHVLHQIGATPSATPEDVRITLQGHGLVVDGELLLYW
jgi:hypothetical protein